MEMRINQGWSQSEAAQAACVSEATLSRIERNLTVDPWPSTKYKIAEVFGMRPGDIWK